MTYDILQSSTQSALLFLMVQTSDHITGLTGASPTVTISKNGAAFGAVSGTVTEIANGWYKVAGNATDTATLGPLTLHATAASGDPCDIVVANIVSYNPQSATNLGLSALPTATAGASNGLLISGTNSGTTTLGALTCTGSFTISDGLLVSRSSSNTSAITATGNGTGSGGVFTSGSGATGDGIKAVSASTNGNGMTFTKTGSGSDLNATVTPLTLAKTTNITGFNDIAATAIVSSGAITTSSGAVSTVTTTTTATNLTNAPTVGDFTSTMKTSIGTAISASAVASVTGNVGGNVVGSVGSVTGLTASNLDTTISSRMATYTQPTGFLAATFPTGTVANTTNITAGTITTATNLTNAPTAGDFTATMKTSLNAATPAVTVSDKTGFSLASAYDFAKGTVAMTESYAVQGATLTPAQALYGINQQLGQQAIVGTTMTVQKRDGATTAKTYTLNSATTPTSIVEAT